MGLCKYIVIIFLSALISQFVHASGEFNAEDEREEVLDTGGKYKIIWNVNLESQIIMIDVIVETTGFVGFGISPNGGMTGADIVIGGVFPNGTVYFKDRHGIGNQEPVIDPQQDWYLVGASENATHTALKFYRLFDSCDENDIKIGNDTSVLIWSFGETDTIGYHGQTNRGSYSLNLLDPPMPPFDPSLGGVWRMSIDFQMPSTDTTYWCTIHKNPPLGSKHHIIGFEPYFPNEYALAHSHHFIVHECRAPDGVDLGPILDPLMEAEGDHCFLPGNMTRAHEYCQAYLFVWAVGGRRTIFPEHVGYPMSEKAAPDYYMFEIHYNNPGELEVPKFVTGIDMFYTPELRRYDAGTITLGHGVAASQLIPPKVNSFVNVGHCDPACTTASVPSDGLNVFNVLLHSHLAGRKLKIRQYRGGKEIPWMSYDDNYNFDFQQNRPLREEIKILQGDQFVYECTYDTSSREGVTIGGFASQEEMCQTFIAYYPKNEFLACASTYPADDILSYFGIDEVRFDPGVPDPTVIAPPEHAGKKFSAVANEVDWTTDKVAELQEMLRFGGHEGVCVGQTELPPYYTGYPDVTEEYSPPNFCKV